jgi:hypothetical protein
VLDHLGIHVAASWINIIDSKTQIFNGMTIARSEAMAISPDGNF